MATPLTPETLDALDRLAEAAEHEPIDLLTLNPATVRALVAMAREAERLRAETTESLNRLIVERDTLRAERDSLLASTVSVGAHNRLAAALERLLANPQKQIRPTLVEAPCLWCGYNGAGYWQADTHGAACPWRNVGGAQERMDGLPAALDQARG